MSEVWSDETEREQERDCYNKRPGVYETVARHYAEELAERAQQSLIKKMQADIYGIAFEPPWVSGACQEPQ